MNGKLSKLFSPQTTWVLSIKDNRLTAYQFIGSIILQNVTANSVIKLRKNKLYIVYSRVIKIILTYLLTYLECESLFRSLSIPLKDRFCSAFFPRYTLLWNRWFRQEGIAFGL